jgi:hypothetical protein
MERPRASPRHGSCSYRSQSRREPRRAGPFHDLGIIEDDAMLFTIAIVLVVLWGMGFLAFHVTSGLIHLLLLAALIAIAVQFLSGRRVI